MIWGRRSWAPLALVALLVVGGCAADPREGAGGAALTPAEPSTALTVRRAGAVVGAGCALLADDVESRRRGLMGRTDLGGHVGMAFVLPEPADAPFWMRNTPLALSIAFFDADGRYVSQADMAPCGDSDDCPRYAAARPYRYALEVPRGRLDELGVGPGATLELGGACPSSGHRR